MVKPERGYFLAELGIERHIVTPAELPSYRGLTAQELTAPPG